MISPLRLTNGGHRPKGACTIRAPADSARRRKRSPRTGIDRRGLVVGAATSAGGPRRAGRMKGYLKLVGWAVIVALAAADCGLSEPLKLLSLRCGSALDSPQRARGAVANVSSRPFHDVVAVLTFRSAQGAFVKSVSARVSGELPPGSTSRFEASFVPDRTSSVCTVAFMDATGRRIPHAQ